MLGLKFHSRVLPLTVAALIISASQATNAEAACPEKSAQKEGSFSITNKQFIQNYSAAKNEIRKNLGPVIILKGQTIKLMKDGKAVETKTFIKTPYTQLKEVAHITLGTYVILINHTGDEKLPEKTLGKLVEFRKAIKAASGSVDKLKITSEQKEDQKVLVSKTLEFIDGVFERKQVSRMELRKFTRSVAKLTLDNAYGASCSQISTIDGIVRGWAKDMTEEEVDKLHVIIQTGFMPRIKQSSLQYFLKLFKEKRPGGKIIAMEVIESDEKAFDLLLTSMLDTNVAIDFYKDRWRMHRDLLSDGVAKYLRQNPPKKLRAGKTSTN